VIPFEPPYTPEMLPEAQAAIEALLMPPADVTVFEYGSGHSTLWLAGLGVDVDSVEHDRAWFFAVVEELKRADLGEFCEIMCVEPDDLPHVIAGYGQFDMVIVDCLDSRRLDTVMAAQPHVKQGGHMVIDDSHWRILRDVPALLKGWTATAYRGEHTRKTGAVRFHETTIYERPHYV
jgi:predicted O-methyltransferase YrrM